MREYRWGDFEGSPGPASKRNWMSYQSSAHSHSVITHVAFLLTRTTATTANESSCRRLAGLEVELDTLCARYKFASSMGSRRGFTGDGALPLIMDVVLVVVRRGESPNWRGWKGGMMEWKAKEGQSRLGGPSLLPGHVRVCPIRLRSLTLFPLACSSSSSRKKSRCTVAVQPFLPY